MQELDAVTTAADWFCLPDYPDWAMRAATPADNPQVLALVASAMPSSGVMLSLSREPDYAVACQAAFVHSETWLIVAAAQPDRVVGIYTLSMRPCYVNGQVEMLRYLGDFRIDPRVQGQKLTRLVMRHLRTRLPEQHYAQAVVLADNTVARRTLHQPHRDFVTHYPDQTLYTMTMTGRCPPRATEAAQQGMLASRVATAADVPRMNAFVQAMAAHFNFLPRYDFAELLTEQPYWRGLGISDFSLVFRDRELVGLYGLWDQKPFKQTRVTHYHPLIALLRPLYNVWARHNQRLVLPPKGELLHYLMLHSPLCRPDEIEVFDYIVQAAFVQTRQRGVSALCYSLIETDPRRVVQSRHYGNVIRGVHGFYSFGDNPAPTFDPHRLSYLECGRI